MKSCIAGFVLMLLLASTAYAAEEYPMTNEEAAAVMNGALGLEWSAEQNAYPDRMSLTLTGESSDGDLICFYFENRNEAYRLENVWGTGLLFVQRMLPDSALKGVTQGYFDLCRYEDMLCMEVNLQIGDNWKDDWKAYRGFGDPDQMYAFAPGSDFEELFDLMARLLEERNEPIYIPSDGSSAALPQPQLAKFRGSRKYEVYTGPGGDYLREANGKATVSTNDWIQVFGEEDGWLLIQYNVSDGNNRFGWIKCAQETAGVSVAQLQWSDTPGMMVNAWASNDPLRNSMELDGVLGNREGKLLATLGNDWAYIEMQSDSGKKGRAFIPKSSFAPGATWADLALDQMYEVAWSATTTDTYSAPEASEDTFWDWIESGTRVYRTGEENGFARVYTQYDDFRNTIYISKDLLIPVQSGWPTRNAQMTDMPPHYIAQEDTILYTQPDIESAPVATLIRGLDVRVLDEQEGWRFVDAWCGDGSGDSNLRGYVRASAVEEGWCDGQTHPVMRIEPPEGEVFIAGDCVYLSGTEMVLRAVSADGRYGVGMVDLRMPCVCVPMEYLVDSGKRGEWNCEAMGREGTLMSDDLGKVVRTWAYPEHIGVNELTAQELSEGTSVTVIAINETTAQIILPGTTLETYFVRARNILLSE